jgi:hypothetical protein
MKTFTPIKNLLNKLLNKPLPVPTPFDPSAPVPLPTPGPTLNGNKTYLAAFGMIAYGFMQCVGGNPLGGVWSILTGFAWAFMRHALAKAVA